MAHILPEPNNLNESTSSSDAADVLIRSTRILMPNEPYDGNRVMQTRPGFNDKPVKVSVKKLREVPSHFFSTGPSRSVSEQKQVYIPPALPANKSSTARISASRNQNIKAYPRLLSEPEKDFISQASNTEERREFDHRYQEPGSRPKGQEILVSQYGTGGKETVRALLKQRSQSAPLRREVKVQLLDRGAPPPPHAQSQPPALSAGGRVSDGTATLAAAVTAAALAATAPLIKAQSDVDARVSRVSEGLRRLQEADLAPRGDAGHSERVAQLEDQLSAVTQQRLLHLEKIQEQQLDLQNRLLGSALGPPSSRPAPRFREPSLDGQDQRGRERSPLETPAPRRFIPLPMSQGVHGNGRLLEEILNDPKSPGTRTRPVAEKGVAMATCACQPESSRSGGLQREGHSRTSRAPAEVGPQDPISISGNAFRDPSRLTETRSVLETEKVPGETASGEKSQPPPSIFEDAGRVLRQVQRQKKVLEENLQSILRANGGEGLQSQLEALSCNRDTTEEMRIKKSVDAWITTLNKDIQAEIAREDVPAAKSRKDQDVEEGRAQDVGRHKLARGISQSGPRPAARKPFQKVSRGHIQNTEVPQRQPAPIVKAKGRSQSKPLGEEKSERVDEEYLMKVYGKALYEGHRRTLKNGPYLRFNSPSPKSKVRRPKVVERVTGVKVKSAKTQTSPSSSAMRALAPPPSSTQPQYLFSPTGGPETEPGAAHAPLEGFLIPMAIPLGQPRMDGAAPLPSRLTIGRRPVTVTAPVAPVPPPGVRRPNVAVLEVKSEKKGPPRLQVQVLPSVDIDSISNGSSPPTPPPAHKNIQAMEGTPAAEDEENNFPGTDFLAVADISQEPEAEEGRPESAIELSGFPEPPAVLYHGPDFPPRPSEPLPTADPTLSAARESEALENRLVDWVEQQLVARMITERHPWTVQAELEPEGEDSSVSTSDIVEAAGGEGLQLFVDAGVPVDSNLIRRYVNDTLTEIVALALGQREGQRPATASSVRGDVPVLEEPLVPTPLPTPGPSPRETPPPSGGPTSPLGTPAVSEREYPAEPLSEGPCHAAPEPERSPMVTPTATPVASPPRVATPTPPGSPGPLPGHGHPWEGAALPLEEDTQHCGSEAPQQHRPEEMSVAREEEPVSLITPSPPAPPGPLNPPTRSPAPPPLHETPPPPLTPSTEDSSSGPSVTETGAAGRHISEGELLLSYGQMAAVRVLTDEGLIFPNLSGSLSSSLHGVQEMDYDPPSEGQVVRRPHLLHHHDPVLSLLAKMASQEVPLHSEGLWKDECSTGEVSEGQRPRLSPAVEDLLTGHLDLDHNEPGLEPGAVLLNGHRDLEWSQPALEPGAERPSSPGQLSILPGMTGGGPSGSQPPISDGDLDWRPTARPRTGPAATSAPSQPLGPDSRERQASEASGSSARRPAPILVRQCQGRAEVLDERDLHGGHVSDDTDHFFRDTDQGAAAADYAHTQPRAVSLRLPSARLDEGSESISTIEADTDTSRSDLF